MRDIIESIVAATFILIIVGVLGYTLIGVSTRVDDIKKRVPVEIAERNWKILRYEGYQQGAWYNHGGKIWYHVANIDNPNVQYRVYVTLWDNELHYTYGSPEVLQRIEFEKKP